MHPILYPDQVYAPSIPHILKNGGLADWGKNNMFNLINVQLQKNLS